jgi:hypothetical protein
MPTVGIGDFCPGSQQSSIFYDYFFSFLESIIIKYSIQKNPTSSSPSSGKTFFTCIASQSLLRGASILQSKQRIRFSLQRHYHGPSFILDLLSIMQLLGDSSKNSENSENSHGMLGALFQIVRLFQAASLIAAIGMAANFVAEMINANTTPPNILIGVLSVVSTYIQRSRVSALTDWIGLCRCPLLHHDIHPLFGQSPALPCQCCYRWAPVGCIDRGYSARGKASVISELLSRRKNQPLYLRRPDLRDQCQSLP